MVDELRPEYDEGFFQKGVRGKYAAKYAEGKPIFYNDYVVIHDDGTVHDGPLPEKRVIENT